jgi:hypothetical protein
MKGSTKMVGLTFKLDKDAEKRSSIGHSLLGWPFIHVIERTLFTVEHRKVDKKLAREQSPHENPADTLDSYDYMLHCICTTEDGSKEYSSILEDEFNSEIVEGIYKVDPSHIGGKS